MKKFLFIFLFMFCLVLTACGEATPEVTPTEGVEPTPPGTTTPLAHTPTDTTVAFSNEYEDKVIYEPTINVNKYTKDAGTDIKPYQLFSDGMCLQRDAINRIWGKASKTSGIAAEINGKIYYGIVKGREWEIYLPKMMAGGPYELTIISESGRYTIKDVYIGEIFFCGGQSNMEWQAGHSGSVLEDLYSTSACVNDNIRMLHIEYYTQPEPTTERANTSKWKSANQTTIKNFSAVAYLFGKKMQEELNCPVGLIAAPVGGSNIEFWLSKENYDKVTEIYKPYINSDEYMQPCLGYNGMLYPLNGLNVRGVLWYQGCSNAFGTQKYYDQALKIFMEQCKEMFGNEQLAFTICELARYEGNPYAYSIVNERINYVADTEPNVVVARNLDLGEWKDIHPKDKRTVASRAAYETLRVFFKKDKAAPIEVSGYTFNADGSVTVELSTTANLINGTNGFEVYVNNKYTYNCTVTVNGNKLTITADGAITKVRYGYQCNMDEVTMNDVSKMVTVYDPNGFPLDLFLIEKE